MIKVSPVIVHERNVWADDTEIALREIERLQTEPSERAKKAKLTCNHTFRSGKSAIEREVDTDYNDVQYTFCKACRSII